MYKRLHDVTYHCNWCGKPFHPFYLKSKYCSIKCAAKRRGSQMVGERNPAWTGGKKERKRRRGRTDLESIASKMENFVKRHKDDPLMLRRGGEACLRAFPRGMFDQQYEYDCVDKIAEEVLE